LRFIFLNLHFKSSNKYLEAMVKKAENILVGISIGDLNGIGSEVVLKTFEDPRMLELCTPVIFANVRMLSFLKKSFESTALLHGIDKLDQIVPGKINVFNLWRDSFNLEYGVADDIVGGFAVKSFVAATKALKEGEIDILVTAPINKYNIQSEEFKFPGHTDYLNQELEGDALMLMVNDSLRVGLFTDHIPVTEVSKYLT
jgi:4-hydroxythreonine-4-phosphate dehydrogenase